LDNETLYLIGPICTFGRKLMLTIWPLKHIVAIKKALMTFYKIPCEHLMSTTNELVYITIIVINAANKFDNTETVL
jgi:hypothetical protein